MLKMLHLANKIFWRECRAGEWFIVFFTLLLTITATTALHFYVDRLTRGFHQQTAALLGGDLVVTSSTPLPKEWLQKARILHLHTAEVWSYSSVVTVNAKLQLVNIQAVSNEYPLFGNNLRKPNQHTIWVDQRLLDILAIRIKDQITIGAEKFRVENILQADKDILYTGWIIAPRVLMRLSDVPRTHTVIPGSRVDYRLLLSGEKKQLQQFRQWITPLLTAEQKLQDVSHQQFALRDILLRAQSYFQLILLLCLLMSGIAIALCIQQFLCRHYNHVALYRCLGASKRQILFIFFWQLCLLACVAGSLGVISGYYVHQFFESLFHDFLQFPLPSISFTPIALGFITCILLLFIFAFPIINDLPKISPLFIWHSGENLPARRNKLYFIFAFSIISVFVYSMTQFALLTFYLILILLVTLACLYGLSLLLLKFLHIILQQTNGALRCGLRQLSQHPKNVILQFIGLNLILIAMLVLGLVRNSIIENWRIEISKGTPNFFAINIAANDIPTLKNLLEKNHVFGEEFYPMVRGRLIALNNKPILGAIPQKEIANPALHRELNLTWMWNLPTDNKIVRGNAFNKKDEGKAKVSVLYKFAKDLKLHLGDELTFIINGQTVSAEIINFRTLDWTSFHPNFYMIFAPGLINHFPTTYITSFYIPPEHSTFLNLLIQKFPNVTIIDVAALLLQMQKLIGQITIAMQYLFLLTLGIGVLIFISGFKASMAERKQAYDLLFILGAGKKYIRTSMLVEFSCLFLLIIATSIIFTAVIIYLFT